jgi:hypothetical protein
MATWLVEAPRERPDFRLFITFLWSEFHDVDSDGDSDNPASYEWSYLYLRNRADPAELVDIDTVEEQGRPCVRIRSEVSWLAAAAAYFLAHEGNVRVRAPAQPDWDHREALRAHLGAFDLEAASTRANGSIWRQATLENPYPNHPRS